MEPVGGKSSLYDTTRSMVSLSEGPDVRVPCLTIAYHPELSRVGETALLKDLLTGGEVRLSRLEPDFDRPGKEQVQPLADPDTSRRPCSLRITGDGSLLIDARESGARFEVDGVAQSGTYVVSSEQLRTGAGVFLGLGGRIVLHLGTVKLPVPPPGDDYGLVGQSEALAAARAAALRVADLNVPVLILGESGTGKELVARAIAREGSRRDRPFVALNMGAVLPSTAASELFGHQRGAFTDAVAERTGAFVDADGGTLFLDEIGLAPLEVQAMLLRTLETGEVRALGGRKPRRVDVRLVAATDTILGAAVGDGKFSEALLNRLSGFIIRLPPLRERREDIAPLVVNFLERELRAVGAQAKLVNQEPEGRPYLTATVMTRLLTAPWRGNVRKLQNVVRQMVIASADEPQLRLDDTLLDIDGRDSAEPRGARADAIPPADAALEGDDEWRAAPAELSAEETDERDRILRALKVRAGNQTQAAKDCDMSRSTFVDRLKKYGIRRPRMGAD